MNDSGLPEDIASAYDRWLNLHPDRIVVLPEDFASIYRWGIIQAVRSTAFLSPQFETLRKLVQMVENTTSHNECLRTIAKLQQQINDYREELLRQQYPLVTRVLKEN